MKRRKRSRNGNAPFGRILETVMKERGLGIREVAEIAKVGVSTVMSWKSGAAPADLMAVRRVAEHLEIDFCYLVTGECNPMARFPAPTHSASAVITPEILFDGYARITIEKIVPKFKSVERPGRKANEGE